MSTCGEGILNRLILTLRGRATTGAMCSCFELPAWQQIAATATRGDPINMKPLRDRPFLAVWGKGEQGTQQR
jgi:hypothetical protein